MSLLFAAVTTAARNRRVVEPPEPPEPPVSVQTIEAGETSFESWTEWTPVQRGLDEDAPGYNSSPPGAWVTPQRAIMQTGDLVGVRAAGFTGCGSLSVEFSLDNGDILSVTEPTVQTDEWGTTQAYWFALPALSVGRHEIRARIKPSVCGMDRILQGNTEAKPSAWTNSFAIAASSLVIVTDVASPVFTIVKAGGLLTGGNEGTHAIGLKSGAVGSLASYPLSECYSHIGYAAQALRNHMGVGTDAIHGSTVYVGEGEWDARNNNTPNSLWWSTVKRHPDARKSHTKLIAVNDGSSGILPVAWAKYQGFTIQLDGLDNKSILYVANGSSFFWFDDCDIIGKGQDAAESQQILANNGAGNSKWITRLSQTGVRSGLVGGSHVAFCRHVQITDCTSDILTGIAVAIGGVVRNHRSLGWLNGVNVDEHGDLFQRIEGGASIEGLVIADWDVECVKLTPDPGVNSDTGMSFFQGIPLASLAVGHDDNTLCENVRMTGTDPASGGQLELWGRIGALLRNVSTSSRLSGFAGIPCDSSEVVNCVFNSGVTGDFYTRIKANGNYEGNHNITGTNADITDTTGSPNWNASGIPDVGLNLSGRNRVTLTDAAGNLRSASDYAGALIP
jgi:hypothetical protein